MSMPDYALENIGLSRKTWDKVTSTPQGRANLRNSLVIIEQMFPDRTDGVSAAFHELEILDRAEAAR